MRADMASCAAAGRCGSGAAAAWVGAARPGPNAGGLRRGRRGGGTGMRRLDGKRKHILEVEIDSIFYFSLDEIVLSCC